MEQTEQKTFRRFSYICQIALSLLPLPTSTVVGSQDEVTKWGFFICASLGELLVPIIIQHCIYHNMSVHVAHMIWYLLDDQPSGIERMIIKNSICSKCNQILALLTNQLPIWWRHNRLRTNNSKNTVSCLSMCEKAKEQKKTGKRTEH